MNIEKYGQSVYTNVPIIQLRISYRLVLKNIELYMYIEVHVNVKLVIDNVC